jgi:cytosine/uracil/thiamine/allantoin permease
MRINILIAHAIVLMEMLLFAKNYNGQFDGIEFPIHSKVIIGLLGGAFLLGLLKIIYSDIISVIRDLREKSLKQPQQEIKQ